MPLASGQTFAGYKIIRVLGSGGMGEVYLAQHPRLPRRDALKVLRPDLSSDDSFQKRFVREADLAAGLRHPHIVGVYDRGEDDGHLWIALDYIEGTDLAHQMEQRYPAGMPIGYVMPIITAVASALDYAHKKGLLHRDVKPANVIVSGLDTDDTDDPSIFLADFGIARPLDDTTGITATNLTVGTVAYAAPEQLTGEQIDGRADQYALAATAYHLLTGLQLFPHSNQAVVIGCHLTSTPPRLGGSRPNLAGLDGPLHAALAKRPDHRFPSCTAFAHALSQAVEPTRLAASAMTAVAPVEDPSPGTAAAPTPADPSAHEGGPPAVSPVAAAKKRSTPKATSSKTRSSAQFPAGSRARVTAPGDDHYGQIGRIDPAYQDEAHVFLKFKGDRDLYAYTRSEIESVT